jgi:hypothetical protein
MASRQVWENFRSPLCVNKGDNEDILSMIKDTVETIHTLERMCGQGATLVVSALITQWTVLSIIAEARGITNYERP